MSQKGITYMIETLFGTNNATTAAINAVLGAKITYLALVDDTLVFHFGAFGLRLWDDGQSCCEHRYITTDDTLSDFIGAELLSIEEREAPYVVDEYGEVHEVSFLVVTTSKGVFTCETHNEHNGYYGGFIIKAELIETEI